MRRAAVGASLPHMPPVSRSSSIDSLHDVERRALPEPLDLLLVEGVVHWDCERGAALGCHFQCQVLAWGKVSQPEDADLVCAVDAVVVSCNTTEI